MEIKEITLHVILKTFYKDNFGYINYVFENLNVIDYDYQFITCTRFPNWNQANFNIGDEGFVVFKYVQEGIDQWFDGKKFNTYNEDILIFLKFIHIKPPVNPEKIILD